MPKAQHEHADVDSMLPAVIDQDEEELVPASGSGVEHHTGTVAFDPDELAPPLARLAQGLTPEVQNGEAKPGQWIITGYSPIDAITIIPLTFARSRQYAVKGEHDEKAMVKCTSGDARVGHGDPGGICAECPLSHWGAPGANGKSAPPACTLQYSYHAYCREVSAIVEIRFKRTGINAAQLINSNIQSRGLGNFAIRLAGENKKVGQRAYAEAKVRMVDMDDEMLEISGRMKALLAGV